jgi:hypothetical protein
MPLSYRYGRTFARIALCFWTVTMLSFPQNSSAGAAPAPPPKYFDHVLIVVLENQNYESARIGHDDEVLLTGGWVCPPGRRTVFAALRVL